MNKSLRGGDPVAAAVVEQRRTGRVGAQVEHAPDGDGVVAAVVLGPQRAVDPRADAVEHGGAGGRGPPRDTGELVHAGAGERRADVLGPGRGTPGAGGGAAPRRERAAVLRRVGTGEPRRASVLMAGVPAFGSAHRASPWPVARGKATGHDRGVRGRGPWSAC